MTTLAKYRQMAVVSVESEIVSPKLRLQGGSDRSAATP
jgi:hypothetical protein